jgi:outer membrane protein TolC
MNCYERAKRESRSPSKASAANCSQTFLSILSGCCMTLPFRKLGWSLLLAVCLAGCASPERTADGSFGQNMPAEVGADEKVAISGSDEGPSASEPPGHQPLTPEAPGGSSVRLTNFETPNHSVRLAAADADAPEADSEAEEDAEAGVEGGVEEVLESSAERSEKPEAELRGRPDGGPSPDQLHNLERVAVAQNKRLQELALEYRAAVARSHYVDELPDPRFEANVFGNPIETAAGSQRAVLSISQAVPWLRRLKAEHQRAVFEACAVAAEYRAERLRIITGVRVGWYSLYILERQIATAEANQELIESLVSLANARIATGDASQGDVLLGTLELSKLEQRLLTYRRRRAGVQSEVNRLLSRPAETPIVVPDRIEPLAPELNADRIYALAAQSQPMIEAARLRTTATRWGIEVARLQRRPEITYAVSYFPTDGNRLMTDPAVDAGEDPWSVGARMTLPIWDEKYDAIRNEAIWRHHAASSSVEQLLDRYESEILDQTAEVERAVETARLYDSTILPQARQTLNADQEAYSNGVVEFDRVVRDYRNLLTLELGFFQALGDLAIANARLSEAAGREIPLKPVPLDGDLPPGSGEKSSGPNAASPPLPR